MSRGPSAELTRTSSLRMERHVQKQLRTMAGIVAVLVGLVLWQHDFIWHAISQNLIVNLAIFATAIAGIALAFFSVFRLDREIIAFKALQEIWADINEGANARDKADPFERHYRCLEDGIVIKRPRILGHVYDLCYEEMVRTNSLTISLDTMQTLVHRIEAKLAEERSLVAYISGLLVFMGLVGTFMGLLKMVGSIGGILTSIQGTNTGGPEAIGQLLGDLQAPLAGMATGFAASLFGLFGSLVVGLLGRHSGQAASIIKTEFEAWLAKLAQLGNTSRPDQSDNGGTRIDSRMMTLMAEIVADYGKAARTFDAMAALVGSLARNQADGFAKIEAMSRDVSRLSASSVHLTSELTGLSALVPEVKRLGSGIERMTATFAKTTNEQLFNLNTTLRNTDETTGNMARLLTSANSELAAIASTLAETRAAAANEQVAVSRLLAGLEQMVDEAKSSLHGVAARTGEGFVKLDRSVSEGLAKLETGICLASERSREASDALAASNRELAEAVKATATNSEVGINISSAVADSLAPIAGEVQSGLDKLYRSSQAQALLLGEVCTRIEEQSESLRKDIAERQAVEAEELTSMQSVLAKGLGEISSSVQTAFVAYANLLQQKLEEEAMPATPAPRAKEVDEPPARRLDDRTFRDALARRQISRG